MTPIFTETELDAIAQMHPEVQPLKDQYPCAFENYVDWKDSIPVPVEHLYREMEIYVGSDNPALDYENGKLSYALAATAEESKEIQVWDSKYGCVFIQVEGITILDRTQAAPIPTQSIEQVLATQIRLMEANHG